MRRPFLTLCFIALALTGCGDDSIQNVKTIETDVGPPPLTIERPKSQPDPLEGFEKAMALEVDKQAALQARARKPRADRGATTATTVKPKVDKPKAQQPRAVQAPPADSGVPEGAVFIGNFRATCYQLTGTTATGTKAGPGSIAVDPSVIKLRTPLYVAGYGKGSAQDTGGAIKGHKIDIWKANCRGWANPVLAVYRLP